MGFVRKWYCIIRMVLVDAEIKYLRDNAGNRSGMKYEATKVRNHGRNY